MTDKPTVLFVCVHNAGRSQMAAAWLEHIAADRINIRSAGSEPADQINPIAIQAMREVGLEIIGEQPKLKAVEGCNGVGRHLAQRLVADGESLSWS